MKKKFAVFVLSVLAVLLFVVPANAQSCDDCMVIVSEPPSEGCSNAQIRDLQASCHGKASYWGGPNCRSVGITSCWINSQDGLYEGNCVFSGQCGNLNTLVVGFL